MLKTPVTSEDDYSYTLHMQGHATTLQEEDENEAVKRLHDAVFKVTGKKPVPPQKNRIGFY